MGNGTYTTYTYDADGNVLDLINYAPNGTVNSSFVYTYNALEQVTTETTVDGEWTYSYDAIGELTQSVFASTNPSVPSQNLAYTYDANGNRIETIENGVTTGYVTNALNQYTSVGDASLSYDANGNLISETAGGVTTTYTYNELNQITGVSGPDGTQTFLYDALGNMSSSTTNGVETQYLVDPTGPGNTVSTYDSTGSLIADYVYGLGLTSQVGASGLSNYYDSDALGSIADQTGSSGIGSARSDYLPFGGTINQPQGNGPFGFVGLYGVTAETNGLSSMGARFYDSSLGRFLNLDPLNVLGSGSNLYAYTGNDPIGFVDPTGLASEEVRNEDPFLDELDPNYAEQAEWLKASLAQPRKVVS